MAHSVTYTQEQMDIAILKNNQNDFIQSMKRIESNINRIESNINNKFDRLEQKVDSNFHCTLGLIFGIYAMGLTGLIAAAGHAYGWF